MTDETPSHPEYSPEAGLLRGRTILVTGAGDGLGRSASLAFADHAATVVLLGRTVARLEAVYDEIEEIGGPQPAIYPMDLEKAAPKHYDDLADTLRDSFGHLDGLLHNAAIAGVQGPFAMIDVESWFQIMQTNLNAPFLLTRACLGVLNAAPDASVVFTSDALGRRGRAYWGAYSVSKFGTEGMMQVLADELSSTAIRCNSVAPVPCRTRLRSRAYPAEDPETLPTPQSLMPTYLYLMGPDSKDENGRAFIARPPGH